MRRWWCWTWLHLATLSTCVATSDVVVASPPPSAASIVAALQPITDALALKYNASFSTAVRFGDSSRGRRGGAITPTCVSGYADLVTRTRLTASDKFPWGSITKMSTGAAIMQLAANGTLNLDEPVHARVDAMFETLHYGVGFNMASLFGPHAKDITTRHLATMRSGVPDFDTAKPYPLPPTDSFRAQVYANPGRDYTPRELIDVPWVRTGKLDFPPGTKQAYSSTNFVLLGMVLAHQAGVQHWRDYAQRAVDAHARDTVYSPTGSPADHTRVCGYDRTSYNGQRPEARPGVAVRSVHGVLSGWTASDYIATPAAAADFAYDLYSTPHPTSLLPAKWVDQMVPYNSSFYGFATFNLSWSTGVALPAGAAYGHLGATYGYQSILSYHPAWDVSIAIATNIERDDQGQTQEALCRVFNRLRNLAEGEPAATCAFVEKGYYQSACTCSDLPTPPSLASALPHLWEGSL